MTVIGAIADDFTGATDLAVAFQREGLRTVLFFGQPSPQAVIPPHDAMIIALKSRTIPAADAVAQSLDALNWLTTSGADQIYFKYCSTFDSTPAGNIGPVLDALSDALSAPLVVMTPSSPEHNRTQYQGHLFVGEMLLSESHMRNHPLTPMTDSFLPRVLECQTEKTVSLLAHHTVQSGGKAVQDALALAETRGDKYVLADAINRADLQTLGRATMDAPLVAGAAGFGGGIAAAIAEYAGGKISKPIDPVGPAPTVVLSGSCSARTLEQIDVLRAAGRATYRLDVMKDQDPESLAAAALSWYDSIEPGSAPLIYSSLDPARLQEVQEVIGVQRSASILERATAATAIGLIERGVRRIVSAGGETSGAIVTAIGVEGVLIGPEAARGVPWIYTTGPEPLALLLKSGNFGEQDMLVRASEQTLEESA
jgi:uncharacterized protein YgbK (DUF1537 family)